MAGRHTPLTPNPHCMREMEPPPLTDAKGGGGGAPCLGCSLDSVESHGGLGLAARRFGVTISLNVFSKGAPVSSTPSARAVSMNRSDCSLSVSLGFAFFLFGVPAFAIWPLAN